jgi:hypothetical protein
MCAVVEGTLSCWALNNQGQCGSGTTTSSLSPTAIGGTTGDRGFAASNRLDVRTYSADELMRVVLSLNDLPLTSDPAEVSDLLQRRAGPTQRVLASGRLAVTS